QTDQTLTQTVTVKAGATATFSISETAITAGQPLHLSVTDAAIWKSAGGSGSAQVTITTVNGSGTTLDSETVTLPPSTAPGSVPGTFAQTVPTAFAATSPPSS